MPDISSLPRKRNRKRRLCYVVCVADVRLGPEIDPCTAANPGGAVAEREARRLGSILAALEFVLFVVLQSCCHIL
ncbi:hypothetical protein RB195_014318 [Necator americanus]|uniref:Uncharacterized protein n=1 Tax=Necator americanus TaxID=51031 RepID=A0ABR1DZI9_NECAM